MKAVGDDRKNGIDDFALARGAQIDLLTEIRRLIRLSLVRFSFCFRRRFERLRGISSRLNNLILDAFRAVGILLEVLFEFLKSAPGLVGLFRTSPQFVVEIFFFLLVGKSFSAFLRVFVVEFFILLYGFYIVGSIVRKVIPTI